MNDDIFHLGIFLMVVASVPYMIYLIGIMFGKQHLATYNSDIFKGDCPAVTVVISAYNEEKNIEARLKNLRDCQYPNTEVMFVDDCSTDKTFEMAKHYLDLYGFNYHLTRNNQQLGTSLSYNIAIRNTTTPIVIVTDADTIFRATAIHWLVARLTGDDKIGAVTGDLQPKVRSDMIAAMENEYRGIYGDMCIWESSYDSTFNFNGAIIALKRSALGNLEIPKGADDANIAFTVIRNGYRAVYERNAVVYEDVPESFRVQYRQKVRRATGLINSIVQNIDLLKQNRPFRIFFFLRAWMLVVSPAVFFVSILINPALLIIMLGSLVFAIGRTFVLNQFYLLMGFLGSGADVGKWESTSSLEKK